MKNKKSIKITKKQKKLLIILVIILGIMLIFCGYKILVKYILVDKEHDDITEIQEEKIKNDLYNYKISNRATIYEKQLFEELETILLEEVISYEDYATALTKIFIADLFTLNNKKSSSDIRSSQYVYEDYQETFKMMVKESLYSNIELDFDGTREQKLPIVKNVIINSVTQEAFYLNNEIIDNEAFNMDITIEYEEDLECPVKYKVVLVRKNETLQIVKAGV